MRWWILAAVLAGWAAAIAAGGFAGAAEPLRLELEPERLWCTAGTVTVVRWEVSGGVEPYVLTVHGEERPQAVGAARLDCPELAAEADGEEPAWGEMTVSGEATDAAGRRVRASARVLIARKLDAPRGLELEWWSPNFNVFWEPVAGAGSLARVESCGRNTLPCGPYLLRYRAVGAADWRYEQAPPKFGRIPWGRSPAGAEEMQIAAMRHPIEAQRPEGLNWSELVRYAATRQYGVVTLQASADRISAEWEAIPVGAATLELSGPGGVLAREYRRAPEDDRWRIHRERFGGLEADSEYVLRIAGEDGGGIELTVRTAPLPAGGTPMRLELSPGRGGRGSCTAGTDTEVDWAVTGGRGPYRVAIAEASVEGADGAARIACGIAPQGGGGGMLGYAPRIVRGTVVDADGARAEAQFTLLVGPPLPPPRVDPPKPSHGGFYVPFWVRASRIEYPSWRVAMRWRAAGEAEWSYNVAGIANGPWDDLGWANGWVRTTGVLADAMAFEAQVARVRDSREIEQPEALAWSEIATLTTASDPVGLVAESTHDSISLSWGPQVEGLNYIATLDPFPPGEEQSPAVRFGYGSEPRGYAVGPQPPYGIRWNKLCPGTQYFAAARSDAASNGEWDTPVGLLITTEPAPGGTVAPPQFVAAAAEPERITLRWAEGACVPDPEYGVSVREYGTGFLVKRGESQRREFKRSEELHEIAGLRPGSTYEIALGTGWWSAAGDTVLVVETPERENESPSDAEPPEFDVKHAQWRLNRSGPWFRATPRADVQGDVELEWHMDGRRLRRLVPNEDAGMIDVMLPEGWYEFRMRGFDAEGRPTRWSEPVRAATTPGAPWIASTRYERDFLILTWDEPEGGIPIDRYVVEWRPDGSEEWQRVEVETGGWAAIPNAPFLDAEGGQVRLRAVSGEYGAGEPSAERRVDPPRPPRITLGFDARGCGRDGSGTFGVAWVIERGVPPFRLRLRPINSPVDAPETVVIEGNGREGRQQFDCIDAARQVDGDWEAAVGFRLTDYVHPPATAGISSGRFGRTNWQDYGSGRQQSAQQLGQRYGEMPLPGSATQSVHAEHVKWDLGLSVQTGQRWMVRTRTAAEPDWAERELQYGSWPMGWWFADGLEPGTRYEYAFGRYFEGGSEWSEAGAVTTLGEVTGIAVSEEGDAVGVEWDAQPDAWKYAVRLRGTGRSWWTLHDATEGDRERAAFAGAAGRGPYAAEVVTPPKDAAGEDESTFQLHQGPH